MTVRLSSHYEHPSEAQPVPPKKGSMADRRISSAACVTLDLPPSCIEICPASPDYFLVGTYELQHEPESAVHLEESSSGDADEAAERAASGRSQARHGSLIVFRLVGQSM
jgi:diphthamide biosynthesis protein 7